MKIDIWCKIKNGVVTHSSGIVPCNVQVYKPRLTWVHKIASWKIWKGVSVDLSYMVPRFDPKQEYLIEFTHPLPNNKYVVQAEVSGLSIERLSFGRGFKVVNVCCTKANWDNMYLAVSK